ncbi:lantibiotic dehydratase [Kitasatospora sp. NPDC091257]|uniref:lantibiotic dehydratase n=1 Tax=Kitasatospora sp. NPDC091257 TaxID=3364084 RepID=UPI003816CAD1
MDEPRQRPDTVQPTQDGGRGWSLAPVAMLRHAGYPLSLLDRVVDRPTARAADTVLALRDEAVELGRELKAALRAEQAGTRGDLASGVGMLRPFPPADLARLEAELGPAALDSAKRYQDAVQTLDGHWKAFEQEHGAALARARRTVVDLFREPSLQQVLLLSNDARFEEFTAWIAAGGTGSDGHVKRMTDLLAMYLQRVTTKNETHSHFGPLAVARAAPEGTAATGITWSTGPLRRIALLSHWAGEAMAEVFSARPEAFETVRPRRRPLAFADGPLVRLYAFESTTGMPDGWRFVAVKSDTFDTHRSWLWEHCDGERTVARLRAAWAERPDRPADLDFDHVLAELVDQDWLIGRWEIPIGSTDVLRSLAGHLAEDSPDLAVVRRFEDGLRRFAEGPTARRAALLGELKEAFEEVTGSAANRSEGRHYADRSILYEEAYSPVEDVVLGPDVTGLIGRELSAVYDLTLLVPRLRIRRELEVLRHWTARRFGLGTPVPLPDFYAAFFADKPRLAAQCEEVDREIEALDREVVALLLDGAEDGRPESVVDRARLEELLARHPDTPPALCNPDVMLAAPDAAAIARGDFLAVVGDCHAVREALTHSSFAPMLQAEAPELLDEIHTRYRELLDEDEVLVDLSRSHPDKTCACSTPPTPATTRSRPAPRTAAASTSSRSAPTRACSPPPSPTTPCPWPPPNATTSSSTSPPPPSAPWSASSTASAPAAPATSWPSASPAAPPPTTAASHPSCRPTCPTGTARTPCAPATSPSAPAA